MTGPLVAILSGAGISTDSGIPDYRGPNGLWRRDPEAEKLATYEYYMADPEIRRRSWQARRAIWAARPEPNAAHRAIAGPRAVRGTGAGDHAERGRAAPAGRDARPQGAGTARQPRRAWCAPACGARSPTPDALARLEAGEADPPCLDCGGILKTATVMFGEELDPAVLGQAAAIARACEVMIAVGTSLQVYPAAGLVAIAADGGARLVIVNAEPTPYDDLAARGHPGADRDGSPSVAGPAVTRHRLDPAPETTRDVFSRDHAPVLTVDPGDTVTVGSLDASGHLARQRFPRRGPAQDVRRGPRALPDRPDRGARRPAG